MYGADWKGERFRPILEGVQKAKPKGPGGRKPYRFLQDLEAKRR